SDWSSDVCSSDLNVIQIDFKSESWPFRYLDVAIICHRYLRHNHIPRKVTRAGRDVAGKTKPREAGERNIVCATDARFQHSATPHRDAFRIAQVMNRQGLRIAPDAPDLHVDDSTASHFQGLPCSRRTRDALVQANWRRQDRLQLGVVHQIVMIKRLLDHEQVEIVELPQKLLIRNGVGAVGVYGKQDVWMTAPHLSHHLNIPTGFDLEFDSLITPSQVSLNPIEKLSESRLDAEAHTYGHARTGSTD